MKRTQKSDFFFFYFERARALINNFTPVIQSLYSCFYCYCTSKSSSAKYFYIKNFFI